MPNYDIDHFFNASGRISLSKLHNMADFSKLSHEHRAAWAELASIQSSQDDANGKIRKIIHLFDSELLSHFKDEEDNVLTDDAISLDLIDEHEKIYILVDLMKSGKAGDKEVRTFISILKGHIKKEDSYFGSIERSGHKSSGSISWIAIVAIIAILAFIVFYSMKTNQVAS